MNEIYDCSIDSCYMYDRDSSANKDYGCHVNEVVDSRGYRVHRKYYCHPPYSSPQYQHPELYFWVVESMLRVMGTGIEFDMKEEWDSSQQAQVQESLGPGWCEETLREIYYYLRNISFTEYYNVLMDFKWRTKLLSFPLFDHYEYIELVGGKLFGKFLVSFSTTEGKREKKGERKTSYRWELLTEATVGREIRRCHGENNVGDRRKKALIRQLALLHQSDRYAKAANQSDPVTAYYQEGTLKYMPTLGRAMFKPDQIFAPELCVALGSVSKEVTPSDRLEKVLLCLCDGKLEKLNLLAEFFARIFCDGVPSQYVWHIHGNSERFVRWLMALTGNKGSCSIYHSSLIKREKELICDQTAHMLFQYNENFLSTEEFANLNHNQMKAYIDGGAIFKMDDPYQENCVVHYSPVVIFISRGDEIVAKKAFKKLPWKDIVVPNDWTSYGISESDCQWLRTCLVAKGLQIIHGFERVGGQTSSISLEQITRQFVDSFCELSQNKRTDCKTFYTALKEYIDAFSFKIQLSGSTTTIKQVGKWMNWTQKEDRKNKNRKAFEGVVLNHDKLGAELKKRKELKIQAEESRDIQEFHDYLCDISKLVIWPI